MSTSKTKPKELVKSQTSKNPKRIKVTIRKKVTPTFDGLKDVNIASLYPKKIQVNPPKIKSAKPPSAAPLTKKQKEQKRVIEENAVISLAKTLFLLEYPGALEKPKIKIVDCQYVGVDSKSENMGCTKFKIAYETTHVEDGELRTLATYKDLYISGTYMQISVEQTVSKKIALPMCPWLKYR